VSADEFENQHQAPVPAYERTWRHPAEIADAARTDFLATPPAISRRLTAFTATISLVASVAVLTVAIPKGINAYREQDEATQQSLPVSNTTGALVKNFSLTDMAVITGDSGSTSALSLGNGLWIVSSDDIAASTSLWVASASGQDIAVDVVASDRASGLALVHCQDKSTWGTEPDLTHLIDPKYIVDMSKYRVVDSATSVTFTPQPSLSTSSASADVPINSTDTIHGLATVRDTNGQLVGIVVRRHHSAWMLNKASIIRTILAVFKKP